MGGGHESRCVGRVYGADGAVRHHQHSTHDPHSDCQDHHTSKYRCRKPYAATQHLMLMTMGVCTRNTSSWECSSAVNVLCCQIEVSASGWSLVQKRHTECDVSECNRESLIRTRPWHTRVYGAVKKKSIGGVIADRGKPKYSEKNLSQCQFVHHQSQMS